VFCALYTHFNYMFIFFTAYLTLHCIVLHYIAPCIVFYNVWLCVCHILY